MRSGQQSDELGRRARLLRAAANRRRVNRRQFEFGGSIPASCTLGVYRISVTCVQPMSPASSHCDISRIAVAPFG